MMQIYRSPSVNTQNEPVYSFVMQMSQPYKTATANYLGMTELQQVNLYLLKSYTIYDYL